jgi:hypothetical protein
VNHFKQHKLLSLVLMLAYALSACSGVPAGPGGPSPQNGQSQEVVFSGTVEAIGAGQWTVSGQAISLSSATAVDASIQVGDNVKVEAVVDQDGAVSAVRIEGANANSNDDRTNASNSNDGNSNDNHATDIASNSNDGQADNSNAANGNTNASVNDSGNNNSATGPEQEVFGTVQAITSESVTINGVTYMISDLTEFKDLIAVGDSIKMHVIANADDTFTVREIERSAGAGSDDNSNSNASDDSSDDSNENDDSQDDNSNGDDDNGNDDDGDDDHNDNDSGSNDNG